MPARKSVPPINPIEPKPSAVPAAPTPPASAPAVMQPVAAGLDRPGLVTALAILTLVSGMINIMAGLGAAIGLTLSIVLLCIAPLALLPVVLGVFEILYAIKLLSTKAQLVRPNQTIAILEILCFLFGNLFSCAVGVVALVVYNDPAMGLYFARIHAEG
jgi:hypothetical protein